jgi:nucleoside-diphosphate-sugar epimerase
MIVFVTGATGALGAPTVAQLTEAGHRVKALVRNQQSADAARALGAEPVPGSLFDTASLARAMSGADAVMHLATRIVPVTRARRRAAWHENDRIRRDGTRHLVDAALASGVKTVVYPSFAPVYADGGDRWLEYGSPLDPTDILTSTLDAEREVGRFTTRGGRGVVLRMAGIYGPHSPTTTDVIALARKGISGFVGPADAFQPLVWDEDAAAALVTALHAQAGTYDIADDQPLTRADLTAALAAAVGRRSVRRAPTLLARAALGEQMSFLLRSQRVSNRRFASATDWRPRVPDATVGLGRLRKALTI